MYQMKGVVDQPALREKMNISEVEDIEGGGLGTGDVWSYKMTWSAAKTARQVDEGKEGQNDGSTRRLASRTTADKVDGDVPGELQSSRI